MGLAWLTTKNPLLHVVCFIVGLGALPTFPKDSEPTIGKAAISMVFGTAASLDLREVSAGPEGLAEGESGPLLTDVTKFFVASMAKAH